MESLTSLLREQRIIVAALRATAHRMREGAVGQPVAVQRGMQGMLLLRMAEGLIDAHKAARFDNDGLTLDLIEDALRHVGERLAAETGDGRDFSRKKLGPV